MSYQISFYPQHFRRTRPYTKALVEQLGAMETSQQVNPSSSVALTSKLIMAWYRDQGVNVRSPEFETRCFTLENQGALMYGEWTRHGSAVYAFEPPLVEALSATGVNEVSINDLMFPFTCAYFHFGAQPGLQLHSGAPVTGAYLINSGISLRVSLTAPLEDQASCRDRAEELYDLLIMARHFDKDLESAIEAALDDDIASLLHAPAAIARVPIFKSEASNATAAFLATHKANRQVFSKCLHLIANALCYVTAFPEDSDIRWQTGTPEKMKQKAETGPPKEAGRAQSKLNAMGYRKARYIGGEFSAASARAEGGQVSPHWRRGHWRRQAHGPQSAQRKLIWMRPTRVLGGAIAEDPRVYKTST